jgi:hypothetical protein
MAWPDWGVDEVHGDPGFLDTAATSRIVVPEHGDLTLQPYPEDRLSQV